jgi:hypothetical protein
MLDASQEKARRQEAKEQEEEQMRIQKIMQKNAEIRREQMKDKEPEKQGPPAYLVNSWRVRA